MQSLLEDDYQYTESEDESLAGIMTPAQSEEVPIRSIVTWPLEENRSGASSRRSTIAMVILFAVGAAAVWYLSMDTGGGVSNPDDQIAEAQVNAFLQYCGSKNTPQAGDVDMADKLVSVFNEYCLNVSLPKWRINDNPFVLASTKPVEVVDRTPTKLIANIEKLSLKSIIYGDKSQTAVINDKFVNVGDSVDEFVVKEIREDSVMLTHAGVNYMLKIVVGMEI